MRIAATALVPAPRAEVFAFLGDLENHWALADRFIEVVSLERDRPGGPAHGGVVRMHGPVGLRRTAVTRVEGADEPALMFGRAEVGRRTRARVTWELADRGEATLVELTAEVEAAAPLDALALRLAGRRWMERRFAAVLAALAARVARPEREARAA